MSVAVCVAQGPLACDDVQSCMTSCRCCAAAAFVDVDGHMTCLNVIIIICSQKRRREQCTRRCHSRTQNLLILHPRVIDHVNALQGHAQRGDRCTHTCMHARHVDHRLQPRFVCQRMSGRVGFVGPR